MLAVWVQSTWKRGKACLPCVLQRVMPAASRESGRAAQKDALHCIAYWVQMHKVVHIKSNFAPPFPYTSPAGNMNTHNVVTHLRNTACGWSTCLLVFNLSLWFCGAKILSPSMEKILWGSQLSNFSSHLVIS